MKQIKDCPLFIILICSGLFFTLLAAGGLHSVYAEQQYDLTKEPLMAVVFRGFNDEIYPWQLLQAGGNGPEADKPAVPLNTEQESLGEVFPTPTPMPTKEPAPVATPAATEAPQQSPTPTPYVRPTPMRESTYDEYINHISADIYGDAGALHAAEYEFVRVDESYFDDALFIGDSRTVGLRDYTDLSEHADFLCETSLTIHKVLKQEFKGYGNLESVLQSKDYGKIYLMVGINELGTGTTEDFIAKYTEVVEKLLELEPGARIIVQANMNVTAERDASDTIFNNSNIHARNNAIATLADNERIFYIDANEVVCDENGYLLEEYTYDQIHLLGKYNDVWKQFLLQHGVREEEPMQATEGQMNK